MATEIEHKFLVIKDIWEKVIPDKSVEIKQAYLHTDPEKTIRIRTKGNFGFITIKGKSNGASRLEFEYEIPLEDAKNLLPICEPFCIEKIRFTFVLDNLTWELDVFQGAHYGLIIAELELEDADLQIKLPEWIEKEVSDDPRFYNSNIAKTAGLNF